MTKVIKFLGLIFKVKGAHFLDRDRNRNNINSNIMDH
jgi:hypothetical protein